MNLRTLDAKFKKLELSLDLFMSSRFQCRRDDKYNLILEYSNDEVFQIPYLPFRPYQIETQEKLWKEKYKKILRVLPRRAGKEYESWNLLVQAAIEQPGIYMMIYPTNVRARMVLWKGAIMTPDGGNLKFLDMIPKKLIVSKNNQEMTIELVNGSVIYILGSDIDPDKLRGTNARGIVISEFAYCDPRVMYILMPILRQNGGWLILQTTFNGMNHAYTLYQNVKDNPSWFVRVESVESLRDENGDRYITEEMIEEDRKSGMPEYLIQQEYYSVVTLNEETMYFAVPMKYLYENDRIIADLYVPNSPVYGFWDIGRNDNNFIVLAQMFRGDPIVIGVIENRNKTPDFYFDEARRFVAKRGLTIKSHFAPHDGEKRDYNSGMNIVDIANQLGETIYIVERPKAKINAINQMRKMIYRTRFNKENTQRLIDCLSNYTKEFDEKNNIYKDQPVHNWTSHGVDAYQSMTLAIDANMINERPLAVIYNAGMC